MDVSDLLDIKAICDAGSYRKAAETLGVTQPTLSNRIAYLEGKLGARLFDREHGRSRPTELATLIANRAGDHWPRGGTVVKGHRTTRGRSGGGRPDRDGACPRPRLA